LLWQRGLKPEGEKDACHVGRDPDDALNKVRIKMGKRRRKKNGLDWQPTWIIPRAAQSPNDQAGSQKGC